MNEQEFYREAGRTLGHRTKKKLTSKENWYKQEHRVEQKQDMKESGIPRYFKRTLGKKTENKDKENKIKAVMFVPYTPGSELIKKLRENEQNMNKITKHRIKLVERTGTKLQDLLTTSDPWKGSDCHRENCLLCFTKPKTEKLVKQDCHQRNVVYETSCLSCQQEAERAIENNENWGEQEKEKNKHKK